jgi:hypothetical protein
VQKKNLWKYSNTKTASFLGSAVLQEYSDVIFKLAMLQGAVLQFFNSTRCEMFFHIFSNPNQPEKQLEPNFQNLFKRS